MASNPRLPVPQLDPDAKRVRLHTAGGSLDLAVVAADLDRTLTGPRLRPSPEALDAIAELRKRGVKAVLVTGRPQREVPPGLLDLFDGAVLEGGAVVGPAHSLEAVAGAEPWCHRMAAWLRQEGIPHRLGMASVSVARGLEGRLAGCPVPYNMQSTSDLGRLDLTPVDVDKGVGLKLLLQRWGNPGACLAFGDAPNDIPLLEAASHGVAVGDAQRSLKSAAHEVAPGRGGAAVARFLRERLLGGKPDASTAA